MEELPVYIPHPKVCHMAQYHGCKNRRSCRLFLRCSQIEYQNKVCCQDCPSCTYAGCSLTPRQRQMQPVYVEHILQQEMQDLNLETRRWREEQAHKAQHRALYIFYNNLFGDLRERRNQRQRQKYWQDPEYYRMLSRQSYNKHRKPPTRQVIPKYLPECGLNCSDCLYEDCILTENWEKKAYMDNFLRNNPDYFAKYRETHREELREKGKRYYAENAEKIRKRAKLHRQKPEVRAQRAAYDQAYRKAHPESEIRRRKRYYAAHRDEINARRRQQRLDAKLQKD